MSVLSLPNSNTSAVGGTHVVLGAHGLHHDYALPRLRRLELLRKNVRLGELVQEYKKAVRMEYIFPDPGKPYAYFALFQRLGGQYIFDPLTSRDDIRCFAAVATNLDLFYPEAERTKNLKSIALKGLRNTRPAQPVDYSVLEGKVHEASLIDIALPDIDGLERRLTDLKGKVVLLDFTVYGDAKISSRNIALREIYSKYKEQGFEIYQISFDPREHFWQQSASNLPWTCVRDGQGAASPNIALYNVQTIPTFYLINRQNEIVLRDNQIEDLEKEIKKLLKE
jgi:peroxiredoxin